MGRTLLGAIVGGVVLFVWGFIWWDLLPFGRGVMMTAPNEDAVLETLKENFPASGMYFLPGEGHEEGSAAWVAKVKAGPVAQVFYRREGSDPMDPMYLVRGFGYMLLLALLAAVVLRRAQAESYGGRVLFVFLVGLLASAAAFSGAVWWGQSLGYHLFNLTFNVTSWLFAGLAMAAVIKE